MRERRLGALAALIALVVVLAIAFVGYDVLSRGSGSQQSGTGAGMPAADADAGDSGDAVMLADYDAVVYTQTGQAWSLTEIADGQPLVINFWATWCPYCVDELPDFQKLYAAYGDKVSFAFVDCADGSRETVEDAVAWLADQGFDDLPVYYDTELEATHLYGATSLPTTVVVDGNGEVLTISPGRIDAARMRVVLEKLV